MTRRVLRSMLRVRPDGAIMGALYNGVTVYVRDMMIDDEGRPMGLRRTAEGGEGRMGFSGIH